MGYCNDFKTGQLIKVENLCGNKSKKEDPRFYLILKRLNINEKERIYYLVHDVKTMAELECWFVNDSITCTEVISGMY